MNAIRLAMRSLFESAHLVKGRSDEPIGEADSSEMPMEDLGMQMPKPALDLQAIRREYHAAATASDGDARSAKSSGNKNQNKEG